MGLVGLNGCGILLALVVVFVAIGMLFPGSAPGVEKDETAVGSCTSADISSGALANINKNMGVYQQAGINANIPWEMIAGIHFRETTNSRITPTHNTGDGVYQILTKNYPYPAGQELSNEDFLVETVDAANFLNGKVENKLTKDTTDVALIKDAFWGYNGRAYGSADNSPYVMSNFDEAHKNMPIIREDGGSPTLPGDTRNGAYTTYVILKGNCK